MYQIIFTSHARVPLSGVELSQLLLKARVNNELAEITGVLVQHRDSWLQVLEGDEDAVKCTFSRICADTRHHCVQVLQQDHVEERSFPGWSLGFLHLEPDQRGDIACLQEIFDKKGRPAPGSGKIVLQELRGFRYGHCRRHVDRGYAPVLAR